jgi:methyl-accepting chemotaxis protein
MSWFYNLRTMTKLLISFALTACVMGVVGYFGISGMGHINGMLNTMYSRDMLGLNSVMQAEIERVSMSRDLRDLMLAKDSAAQEKTAHSIDEHDVKLRALLDDTEKTLVSADGKVKMAEIRLAYGPLLEGVHAMIRAANAKDRAAMEAAFEQQRALGTLITANLESIKGFKLGLSKTAFDESDDVFFGLRARMGWLIAFGVALGIASGIFLGRAVGNPLRRAVAVLDEVAGGDFTRELVVSSKDEVGQLGTALNAAVSSVRDALNGVRSVAEGLASSSGELSSAAQEISSGAQEQAASLEETAASLEEITSTVKQTGDNAQQASRLASGSRDIAEKGGRTVRSAVDAMSEISSSSKKIADIITTIDEIAFQTNLLALNAAVEAARAGEQGRGFAVVATEVRNLAQRSAAASKEIKALIGDSVQKVDLGSKHVTESGATLDEIVGSVKHVTDIVAEIAAATREQNTGLEQVNKAVSQLDQVTQSNAAQTEELSSTAESLAQQAQELQALVAKFKTGSDSGRSPPTRPVLKATTLRRGGPSAPKRASRAVLTSPLDDAPTAIVSYVPPKNGASHLEEF